MEKTGFQECEAALTPVPKHIFRSRFTWCCYEAARSYFLYAWSLWVALMVLIVLYVGLDVSAYPFWIRFIFFFAIFGSFAAACPGYIIWNLIMARRAVLADLRALADSVDSTFNSGHGIGPEKWDEVASQINSKLYVGGLWKTPYCLYDGVACELFFRVYFMKPSFEGRVDKKSLYSDADNEKNSNLVARYQNKIEEQFEIWAQWFAGDFADDSKECLPKETFRNKFTWNCSQVFKTYFFRAYMLLATAQSILISRGELSVFAFWFVVYSGEAFCIAYGMGVSKFTSISTSDQVKYLSIIKGVSPGTDNDRWDLVAKTMNSYLHDDYARKTRDLFFDGKDCFQFFEKRFKPLVTGKVKQTCTASYELVPLVAKAMNVCV